MKGQEVEDLISLRDILNDLSDPNKGIIAQEYVNLVRFANYEKSTGKREYSMLITTLYTLSIAGKFEELDSPRGPMIRLKNELKEFGLWEEFLWNSHYYNIEMVGS